MTIHITSLEHFMLKLKMDKEIEKQRSQKPRWHGPMIFQSRETAYNFVRQQQILAASDNSSWRHAADIFALTYDLYCTFDEAKEVCKNLISLQEQTAGGSLQYKGITAAKIEDEITIEFQIGDESYNRRFVFLEDMYVPIPW